MVNPGGMDFRSMRISGGYCGSSRLRFRRLPLGGRGPEVALGRLAHYNLLGLGGGVQCVRSEEFRRP